MSLNDTASRAMSSSPRTGIRSVRWPSANRSAIRDADRTGSTIWRATSSAIAASSTSSTTPPVAIVPRTSAMVALLVVQREDQVQLEIGHRRRRRAADDQRRPGEAVGVHGGVLVADLAGLDEVAQRVGHLVDGSGRGRRARAVAGHHQHRVECAGQTRARRSALRSMSVLRASCRLLSSERVSSPPTMPLTVVRARSISSVAAPHLDLEDAVGDLAGQHEAEHQDDGQRQPQRQRHHPQLQRAAPREAQRPTQRAQAAQHRSRDARLRDAPSDAAAVEPADHGGPALYPTPRTVSTTCGFSGSFSTLARSRWTCTFTNRVSAGCR